MSSWNSVKAKEAYAKGRHAVRFDYVAGGTAHQSRLAEATVPRWRAAREYEKEQARIVRQQSADYNHIIVSLARVDKTRKRKVYGKGKASAP